MRLLRSLWVGAALATAPLTIVAQAPLVPDSQAGRYVGQTVTVVGTVVQVSVSGRSNTTFLNFGARYPNNVFTAVIFRSAASRFSNPQQWGGKQVQVTGAVRLYQGKPEIVLNGPGQIAEYQGDALPQAPSATPSGNKPPPGATAMCRDSTYSFARSRRGACSHHGGVAQWF